MTGMGEKSRVAMHDWLVQNGEDLRSAAVSTGFRFGPRGAHTSRTMMLRELSLLLDGLPEGASAQDYYHAAVDDNILQKGTAANRHSTYRHLREQYALNPEVAVFRVLRRLWALDAEGQPLLALLCALSRDPLLRATADPVLSTPLGEVLVRTRLADAMALAFPGRLNPSVLDKTARNAASSWTQAGHLQGQRVKTRRQPRATPAAVAMALWLGQHCGFVNEAVLTSCWVAVLGVDSASLWPAVMASKRLGLVSARRTGDVVEVSVEGLDPGQGGSQ